MTLPAEIRALIAAEQARQGGRFVPDQDAWLARLAARAELVAHHDAGRLLGFVAFYGNDPDRRFSYISLIAVDPAARGRGVGRGLVDHVLGASARRGFARCRLEVAGGNAAARRLYADCGFAEIGRNGDKLLMEAATGRSG